MSRLGWWELATVAATLGYGSRRDNLARLVTRLVAGGLISGDEFSSQGRETQAGGTGGPRQLFFLAPSAVAVVAAHARTPEAAAFRRETFRGLAEAQTEALAQSPVNALPGPSSADVAVLQRAVFELERRFDVMTVAQAGVVERVEKLERRIPEQLRLPGVSAARYGREDFLRMLIDGLRDLGAVGEASRGLKCAEVLRAVKSGDPNAAKVATALHGLIGSKECSPIRLGTYLDMARCLANAGIVGQKDRKDIARWFVVSNATH